MQKFISKTIGKRIDNTFSLFLDNLTVYEDALFNNINLTGDINISGGDLNITGDIYHIGVLNTTGSHIVSGSITGYNGLNLTGNMNMTAGDINLTGSMNITGGTLNLNRTNINLSGNLNQTGNINITGMINVRDNTNSTSTTTGSITTLGGLGVSQDIRCSGLFSTTTTSGIVAAGDVSTLSLTVTGLTSLIGNVDVIGDLDVAGDFDVVAADSVSITSIAGLGSITLTGLTVLINGATGVTGDFDVTSSNEITLTSLLGTRVFGYLNVTSGGITSRTVQSSGTKALTLQEIDGSLNTTEWRVTNKDGHFEIQDEDNTLPIRINTGSNIELNRVVDFSSDINLDGTPCTISITDNQNPALRIREGSNDYISFRTSNGNERIYLWEDTEMTNNASLIFNGSSGNNNVQIQDNLTSAFAIREGSSEYLSIKTTDAAERVYFYRDVEMASDAYLRFNNTDGNNIVSVPTSQDNAFEIQSGGSSYLHLDTNDAAVEIDKRIIFNSGIIYEYLSSSATNYVLTNDNYMLEMTYSLGSVNVDLPSSSTAGRTFIIFHNLSGAAAQLTITPALGETIEGLSSFVLYDRYQKSTLVSNGSGLWYLK